MNSLAMHHGYRIARSHFRRQRAVENATATVSTANESAIARTTTVFAESLSETWDSVVAFFSSDDDSDHDHDHDATKMMMVKSEESDEGTASLNDDAASGATDASSSDSDAETEATMPEEEEEAARVSATTTTADSATADSSTTSTTSSTGTQIKLDVLEMAKRVFVLVKIAMAAISRQCVAAMRWVLGVRRVCSGATVTTGTCIAMTARSSDQNGSSSSCSSSSSSTSTSSCSSVSASVCASSLCTTLTPTTTPTTTPTPIAAERASPEASCLSAAASDTSAGALVAMDAIEKTSVEAAVVDLQQSEPATTIGVVAVASKSDDDEAEEKMVEDELLHLHSEEDDSQDHHRDVVVAAPTSPLPGPRIAMASSGMLTCALIEAAVAEQLKCEDQLVNVLRCVLLASNWHAQAGVGYAPIRIRVTRVAFTASLPVHEPVIGTTTLLSIQQATAALVHQRAMVHSAIMAGTATMACVTTCLEALQSVRGGGDDDVCDGAVYDDALWLWDREEQLTATAALAFHWIDRLIDALAAVEVEDQDEEEDEVTDADEDGCDREDATDSVEQTKVVSAWCEPPQDEAQLDAAWAKWVETWANEMAPRTYEARAMPRENLTPAERASVDARISAFGESIQRAWTTIKAVEVGAVAEAVLAPVLPVVEAQAATSSSKTSTSTSTTATVATEATEATETTETTETETPVAPSATACGSTAPRTSTRSQAATPPSSAKVTMRRNASPTRVSTRANANASATAAIKPKPTADPTSKSTSKLKATSKARWR